MTSLPEDWRLATLDELKAAEPRAITDGPFGSQLARVHYTAEGPRVVRLQNIGDGRFVDARAHISEDHFDTLSGHEVLSGDLLVASLGEVLPRACIAPDWLGPAIVKADCIRVRLAPGVDRRWVMYSLQRPAVRRWANDHRHGVGRPRLGLKTIRQLPVPLPPLDEQRRIVAIVEDHLSRLDAADADLSDAVRRIETFDRAALISTTRGFEVSTRVQLSQIAEVRLGRQRSPANHAGSRMRPYLRAANVRWDALDLQDIKTMNFTEHESEVYELQLGDILLTEASGSAAEVGKSALYRGEVPGACFQNTVLRVRCYAANPEFVQKYLLADAMAGRFMEHARGVGIHHLGRARLAEWPIEVPPLPLQVSASRAAARRLEASSRLRARLNSEAPPIYALRQSLMAAAFSGRLTGRSSDTEVIEDLAEV
jgi:hypothetical protein